MGLLDGIGHILGGILSIPKDVVTGVGDLVTGKFGDAAKNLGGTITDPLSGIAEGAGEIAKDPLAQAAAATFVGLPPALSLVLGAGNYDPGISQGGAGNATLSGLPGGLSLGSLNSPFFFSGAQNNQNSNQNFPSASWISGIFQKIADFSSQFEKQFEALLGNMFAHPLF